MNGFVIVTPKFKFTKLSLLVKLYSAVLWKAAERMNAYLTKKPFLPVMKLAFLPYSPERSPTDLCSQ